MQQESNSLDAATEWLLSELGDTPASIASLRKLAEEELRRPRDAIHREWAALFLAETRKLKNARKTEEDVVIAWRFIQKMINERDSELEQRRRELGKESVKLYSNQIDEQLQKIQTDYETRTKQIQKFRHRVNRWACVQKDGIKGI